MESPDMTAQNIDRIAALFPNCVTEASDGHGGIKRAIDFELLKQMLSPDVVEGDERYEFTWVGKKAAIVEANKPIRKTLRPCVEESKDWDTTENLYIEGDNLEVLKLLQESYLGKVKMIYIDPPYNTGNDFIYADDFMRSQEEENEQMGMYDEHDNRLFKNTDTNGRFHSDWCSMIYSRLMLARNLLADDGAIFISIDDNEASNLTKICDELFGDTNRIALICHKSRASVSNDKIISSNHNTILFYAKNITTLEIRRKSIGLDPMLDGFDLDDNDGNGAYRLVPVDGPGGAKKGNPFFEFLGVKGYWRFSKETMQEKYDAGLVVRKGNSLYQKYFKSNAEQTRRTATTWWDDAGLTSSATSKLKTLMGGATFDTPKPVELLERMLKMITFQDKGAIILDFFSGSATTAHAVMQLNAEDGGNRKFIMVQLPELTDEKSEAYKAGYKNICEIGKERIRRAGKKIKADSPLTTQNLDTGFRVLKLDSSNMLDVYYTPEEFNEKMIFQENVKADRTDEDLLFQVMLELGIELSASIRKERLGPQRATVFNVDDGYLMATFEQEIDEATITEIAKRNPGFFVMRDASAASDNVLDNFEQLFRHYSPETSCRII